jgi:hypothetical protein
VVVDLVPEGELVLCHIWSFCWRLN